MSYPVTRSSWQGPSPRPPSTCPGCTFGYTPIDHRSGVVPLLQVMSVPNPLGRQALAHIDRSTTGHARSDTSTLALPDRTGR